MSLEPFDPEDPGRARSAYDDLAASEIAFFAAVGRLLTRVGAWIEARAVALAAAFARWRLRTAQELRDFTRWLELAIAAKSETQHVEMAMHANRLAGTWFNPFKWIACGLGGLVLVLAALLAWQWPRANILAAENKALKAQNRAAIDSSWAWKAKADATGQALAAASRQVAEEGRVRAQEADRSVALANDTARRSARLAKRQKERMTDAIRAAGGDDRPLDLGARLRELATSSAAAGGDPNAAAPGGDPATGVPGGPAEPDAVRASPAAAPPAGERPNDQPG